MADGSLLAADEEVAAPQTPSYDEMGVVLREPICIAITQAGDGWAATICPDAISEATSGSCAMATPGCIAQ